MHARDKLCRRDDICSERDFRSPDEGLGKLIGEPESGIRWGKEARRRDYSRRLHQKTARGIKGVLQTERAGQLLMCCKTTIDILKIEKETYLKKKKKHSYAIQH